MNLFSKEKFCYNVHYKKKSSKRRYNEREWCQAGGKEEQLNCKNPHIFQLEQIILSAYMMAAASAEKETFKNVGLLKRSKENKLEYPWILTKLRSRGLCM